MEITFKIIIAGILVVVTGYSCLKVETKIYDRVIVQDFWNTPDQIAAGVAPAYAGLRNEVDMYNTYPLLECSTDEVIVPTRGGDWYDNGEWEKLWKHTWTPSHSKFQLFWDFIYGGISGTNAILRTLDTVSPKPPGIISIQAELKTVRAYYYFLALDLFGNVPLDTNYTGSESSQPATSARADVFSFVEHELLANISSLSGDVNLETYGRCTRWFAYAMLAKLYINAGVYAGNTRWNDCINMCDSILQSNQYQLEADFFANFAINNENSKENIFVIPYDINANLQGFWLQAATLHYSSNLTFGLDAGGANGHCTPAADYNLFDTNDTRRRMFLVGQQYINQQQYNYQPGSAADAQTDPATNLPLIFNPEIPVFSSVDPAFRLVGARCAKWEFNKIGGGAMSNDFAIFRLADIILMKAEAQFRNGDILGALTTINQQINGVSIRNRANMPDFSQAEMTADGLLAERARELSWEGWRRNDMIRLGHFLDARVPEKAVSEEFRKLYPIPQAELAKNPNLKQNPGY